MSILQLFKELFFVVLCPLLFIFFPHMQISAAEFTCPPWLSFGAMKLITRILDPNPVTVSNCLSVISITCSSTTLNNWRLVTLIFKKQREISTVLQFINLNLRLTIYFCGSASLYLKSWKMNGLRKIISLLSLRRKMTPTWMMLKLFLRIQK